MALEHTLYDYYMAEFILSKINFLKVKLPWGGRRHEWADHRIFKAMKTFILSVIV